MIIKTRIISFWIIGLFLIGCKNPTSLNDSTSSYYIDLETGINNIKSIPLVTLGRKLEYIPLETSPECLIKRIKSIAVTDSFMLISDSNLRVLLFDITGKYIRQIGINGRGPGEYTDVQEILVENNQKEIYVLSYRKVNVYDFKGQFKRDFKLIFLCQQFIMDENDDLILHNFSSAQATTDPVYSWYIYDKTGNVRGKILNTLKRVNGGVTVPMSPLYMYNGSPHFMEFGIDTLYNYSHNKKTSYAIFNLGETKHPIDPTLSESLSNKNWIWVSDIRETKDLLFVNVWCGPHTQLNCVFNKTTSAFSVLNENGFTNDIDNGMNFWPKKIINDNLMIDYINALDLMTYEKNYQINKNNLRSRIVEIADQLSVTSNPVVVFLKN